MKQVRCAGCGLVYRVARLEGHLTTGCRRCGGELRELRRRGPGGTRAAVTAVRSAVTGRERLPFG